MKTSMYSFVAGAYYWWLPREWDAWAWLVKFDIADNRQEVEGE